jgi:signal transduction histidine kinase
MRQHEQPSPRTSATAFTAPAALPGSLRSRRLARELLAARIELAAANEALRRAQARCEQLEECAPRQALEDLAAASHDLRNPLQVIAAYVELLDAELHGPVNARQRTFLTHVRAQVDHLAAVVGSILALARATRGAGALELSDIPVRELLAEARTLVEPFATATGVTLVVDDDRAPTVVRGDRAALARVLVNLAGNAIKFTARGGCVALSAAAVSQAVELRVADSGPGIPCTQLDRIFEPFVQGDSANAAAESGVGLGLTIARDLTRLMGGELLVHSVVGVGSLFTVRFPAVDQGASAAKVA